MHVGLKPTQSLVSGTSGCVDFRIGFRNKKKDVLTGFHPRSKINLRTKIFMIALGGSL